MTKDRWFIGWTKNFKQRNYRGIVWGLKINNKIEIVNINSWN